MPSILQVVYHATGMDFAAVARVTEGRWIACSVLDRIGFGLQPGGELKVETTICHEIRQSREGVVIDHAADDEILSLPSHARHVRLPELYLDADHPPRRLDVWHALRHRSPAAPPEGPGRSVRRRA